MESEPKEVEEEFAKYQKLSAEIDALNLEIESLLTDYSDLLDLFLYTNNVSHSKISAWKSSRKKKYNSVAERLALRWSDLNSAANSDPELLSNEQIYQSLVRLTFRRSLQRSSFQNKRKEMIQKMMKSLYSE